METLGDFLDQLISGDDEAAEAAAMRLPAYGPKAYDALVAFARDDDTDRRWWALRAMANLYDRRVALQLVAALDDPDPAVRAVAARGLQEHPEARAVEALLDALGDPDSMVARLAANALVAIGRPAVPLILETFDSSSDRVRMEIARILALIGDTRAVPTLFHALDDDSALIRHWVDEGLERMGIGMAFFKP
jgi:hypothetical protein